ncbi:MAG: Phosphocholine transferase AnkX [Wolbachia endosymbiont of Ctenocephalides felis wCfeF]|nr:MAG: Phosphocholine transferase AnkX [Wolbachia endosymbiont of Ctenocephalides felis wCfeF]
MEYNQWSETLRIINADNDLNESNIIEKIKEKLGENSDTYREWHDSQFNISHAFNGQFTLLHVAAGNGYRKIVEALKKNRVDINALDKDDKTPLHYAAQNCPEEILFLMGIGANSNIKDVNGKTPSNYYAQRNNKETKDVIIKDQESANILHKVKFNTCLAAKNGHIEALKTLITKGAKIDAVDENGLTTLYWTARNGYTEILETLIAKGARIDVVDKDGLTALHWAARNGHTETVRALMERVDVNVTDKMGYTPLYWAAVGGHIETAKALIEKGAKVDAADNAGLTPLHWTVQNCNQEMMEVLIKNKADVNKVSKHGYTPLHFAVETENKEIVKILTKNKASFYIEDNFGSIPLQYAADNGLTDIVEVLIENKENFNVADKNALLLSWAAENGYTEIVKALIGNNTDINKIDAEGYTPLYRAVRNDHVEIVNALLQKGANPLLGNRDVETLKRLAELIKGNESRHPEETQQEKKQVGDEYELFKYSLLLRDNGLLIDVVGKGTFDNLICTWFVDVSGLTKNQENLNAELLSIFKDIPSKDVYVELETFLKKNANDQDLNKVLNLQRGESKLTLLHVVSSMDWRKEQYVNLLLEAKADPNVKDDRGKTPLHYATDENIIKTLSREAKLNEQDNEGKTPLDIAINNHNYEVEKLLLTTEQRSLKKELYNALGNPTKLKELLKKQKDNQDLKRILNLHNDEGKSKILQFACEEAKRLLLEAGTAKGSDRKERVFEPGTLWDNLMLRQQQALGTFLVRVEAAKNMNELKQIVNEAIASGVKLNLPKQGKLYGKTYESKYGFMDYVVRKISKLKKESKVASDVEVASGIVCQLVSEGAVLYNIKSIHVIDELEEFEGHKNNMKQAFVDYKNHTLKFMEIAKSAVSGRVKDAKMDNSTFYLRCSKDSTVKVAEIINGARSLSFSQKSMEYRRDVIRIGKSEVEIITEKGIRNYTDLAGGSDIVLTFPTSLGELEVRLYPDKKNQDLIRVEGNKEMLKELEDCGEEVGKNCRLGGLSVKEAIERGYFIRSGELMRFEAMSSSVNSSLDNVSLPFSVKESIQKVWSGA